MYDRRLGVVVAPDLLHENRAADAESEQEPIRVGLGQRLLCGGGGHRVACVDVGDAQRDGQRGRRRQQQPGHDERISSGRLVQPQRPVAETFELRRRGLRRCRRMRIEGRRPDPHSSQLHGVGPYLPCRVHARPDHRTAARLVRQTRVVVRVKVIVSGRVQGVWFRESCRREAAATGVSGWVANRADGTVHAVLQGEPRAVDRVLAWMRHGPPRAEVTDVVVTSEEPVDEHGFTVR